MELLLAHIIEIVIQMGRFQTAFLILFYLMPLPLFVSQVKAQMLKSDLMMKSSGFTLVFIFLEVHFSVNDYLKSAVECPEWVKCSSISF